MRTRPIDYFVILLALFIAAILVAAFAPYAHSKQLEAQPCSQYDMTRGARISDASDDHMMEHPERIKAEIVSLLSESTKERGLEGDLRNLAEMVAGELKGQAKYKDAIDVFQALIEAEKNTATNNISLVDTYNALADTYFAAKEFARAEQTLQTALKINEGFYGEQSYEAARSLDKLADLQRDLKNFQVELQLREKAHNIRVKEYGANSEYLIDSYTSLADLAARMGEPSSLQLYFEALKLADRHHPAGSAARTLREKIRTICPETKKK